MIAGYILTGGKNRRMKGVKKLFLQYRGKTFLERIETAMGQFSKIYLSVENTAYYEEAGLPMIVDIYPGIGPMGGIYSGLYTCEEEALFVVACDMPLLNEKIITRVCEVYQKEKKVTIVQTGERLQPLVGIYPAAVLPLLDEMIEAKEYRMRDLIARTEVSVIQLEESDQALKNINTPEEYQKLKGDWNGREIEPF